MNKKTLRKKQKKISQKGNLRCRWKEHGMGMGQEDVIGSLVGKVLSLSMGTFKNLLTSFQVGLPLLSPLTFHLEVVLAA